MRALFLVWYHTCLLRATPQQVPASPYILLIALVFYAVIDVVVALPGAGWGAALGLTLLDMAVMVGFTVVALKVTGKGARVQQTLSALAGTGALLGVAAFPVVVAVQQEPVPAVAGFLWLGLIIWSLAVRAHILRHALALPFAAGLVLSTLYAVTVLVLIQWLFPVES